MVKHIVMWSVKDGALGLSKKQIASEIKARLEALRPVIKEIKSLEVGINFLDSPAAYDVALYCEFSAKEDLNAYQIHPDHVKLKDFILAATEKRAVVDYEI
ncbi:MAG: Dabb family protein [Spirochaetota bacterium]